MSEPTKDRAFAVSQFVTAREVGTGYVLLFAASDEQEGYRSPASEIYLGHDDIRRLAAWITPPLDTKEDT